ncbi:glycosyltransferase [Streptomyces sp. NPDC046859]|uniref:glycosyltransferase n=1 Tax=Streptomyces sp. NPDC046859 TaxID=3155734 RepID=UPI003403EF16
MSDERAPPEPSTDDRRPGSGVPALSVVVPAYDERDRLARTLDTVPGHLDAPGSPWDGREIVVVDDGSTAASMPLRWGARRRPRRRAGRSTRPTRCGRPCANSWTPRAGGSTEYGYGTCTGRDARERY